VAVTVSTYEGLRGGTQLIRVGDDAWLGIGHEMMFVEKRKYYWHVWYLVDSRGKLKAASAPMKLAPNGIEFAAGMAIDGDRVVVSFGVDDMECKIGETSLAAVLEKLTVVTGVP
jgi:Uri superfamily endonuclease